jgi:YD repeat-containing protein
VNSGGAVTLFSRNRKSLNKRFSYIVEPVRGLPDGTVVDGEIVALDDDGRPVFNLLQNFTSESARIRYFLFDLLCYKNRDLTRLPLLKRRKMLRSVKFDQGRIAISECVEASAEQMLSAVREQRLEGVVGKRKDSIYEPGKRSGAWIKHRVNLGQEFVIGGFTPGPDGLDAIIVGYYRGNELIYVARTRNGFVPASRRRLFDKLKPLVIPNCPFVNLPEARKARWGEALTAERMKKCATYGYDTENNLTSIKDANLHTTSLSCDAFGRVSQTTFSSRHLAFFSLYSGGLPRAGSCSSGHRRTCEIHHGISRLP